MNGDRFIEFLKALLGSAPGKIFLIVDGSSVHKAKKVREFVENEAGRAAADLFLPSYSPELNPDEWVWNNVKNDRIARAVIMSKDDLKTRALGAPSVGFRNSRNSVRGFFRDPSLAYILELHGSELSASTNSNSA